MAPLKKIVIACLFSTSFFSISCFVPLMAQENPLTYDLRSCDDSFASIWNYYSGLTDKLFTNRLQLRSGSQAAGRFSERSAIPNLAAIAEKLGADGQIFANILWRDMGKDRVFRFVVQRSQDAYTKTYYPFYVYEEHHGQDFPPVPQCQEQTLLKTIPQRSAKQRQPASKQQLTSLPISPRLHVNLLAAHLPVQNVPAAQSYPVRKWPLRQFKAKVELRLIAQNSAETKRAASVLLEVADAQQLCTWQQRYGQAVIIPAQQLPGSSGWRFRDQQNLPYGLTRLELYLRGTPYPLAYTSYDDKNYAVMADFETGYRVHYLPRVPAGTRATASENDKFENMQITGTVMFWLAPVSEIPEGLPAANEDFATTDSASDCSTYTK